MSDFIEEAKEIMGGLEAVSLEELERSSALLLRQEHKYIINTAELADVLKDLSQGFRILEHGGKRMFRYESLYFDHDYISYRQHHQGKRRRFKVRTRYYADSGECFLEMKLKRTRSATDKKRTSIDASMMHVLDKESLDFINDNYKQAYGEEFGWKLIPIMKITNERVTLVVKEGAERLTMDFNLKAINHEGTWHWPSNVVIVETKTKNGNGVCDRILRAHGMRSIECMSKYCIGVAQIGLVRTHNEFNGTIKHMQRIAQKAC